VNVIAFHVQHDASVAVAIDGQLAVVLELERLFGVRYFESAADPAQFEAQWREAISAVCDFVGTREFDVAVTSWVPPSQRAILQRLVQAAEWRKVSHHRAHALHGHCDAPFERSLVLSYDGGGNDGTFRVFAGDPRGLHALETIRLNLGTPYRLLATTMPEVTGRRPQPRAGSLALSGKLMAYAALGRVRESWLDGLREYYENYNEPRQALDALSDSLGLDLEADSLDEPTARDLAASSQEAFMRCLDAIADRFAHVEHDGLVLTGGCALNVVANQRLRERWRRPVHVPPAPNDAGIAVGALWDVARPTTGPSVFCGLPLVRDVSERELGARGARRCSQRELASVLASGAFVGVAADRAEHGPRALGHRSILALAGGAEVRQRINQQIKSREWYRPVAPVVRASDAQRYFDGAVDAPYMSFAPRLREDAARRFAAIAHVDATARVQTVNPGSLLHELLDALDALGREPLLVNTSFNIRARPLIHRRSEALEALNQTALDFAWIDGWLVPKSIHSASEFAAMEQR
jgi:carbamoyltransferase